MSVVQVWCKQCKAEVIARLHDDASGERRTARCPWCDHNLELAEADAA